MKKDSVLQQVFYGHIPECARDIGVTDKRLYQILTRDDPYRRLWRLLDVLAHHNPEGMALVVKDIRKRLLKTGVFSSDLDSDKLLLVRTSERKRRRVQRLTAELQLAVNDIL